MLTIITLYPQAKKKCTLALTECYSNYIVDSGTRQPPVILSIIMTKNVTSRIGNDNGSNPTSAPSGPRPTAAVDDGEGTSFLNWAVSSFP